MQIEGWQKLSLDELALKVAQLPKEARDDLVKQVFEVTAGMKFLPNVGPQSQAYFSPADVLLYGGSGGAGKAIWIETPIPTPSGWTTMGRLSVGDIVFDKDGQPCRVVAATPVMIGRACHAVRFDDKSEIIADADHQWLTMTYKDRVAAARRQPDRLEQRRAARPSRAGQGRKRRPDLAVLNSQRVHSYLATPEASIRTTREIAASVIARPLKPHLNHSIALAGAVAAPERQLAIDPYLLGAWLGDGTSASASITIAEQEMVQHVALAACGGGYSMSKRQTKYAYGITGGLQTVLRSIGLLSNKHIPTLYLRASIPQRVALLQGLMDTDGYVTARGACEFTTTSEKLRDGIMELLLSLGIKATATEGVAVLNGRDCGPKYRVKFTTHLTVFRLARKAERQAKAALRATTTNRYIASADIVPSRPVRCIEVDSPSRTYLCGRQFIPTHNSALGVGLSLTAHKRSLLMRQQYNDLDALTEFAIKLNGTRQGFNGSNPPSLRTSDGRFIQFSGAKMEQWQGHAFDLKFFDEAVQIAEEVIRFHLGWIRSTEEGQRTRAILGTNPPVNSVGDWIIGMFRPWLDLTHPNPADPGDLRWFVTDPDGKDFEVEDNRPHQFPGQDRPVIPMSRTFIPGKLSDNPYLARTDYQGKLDALPEPLRSAVRDGNFMAHRSDQENQVIPTNWIMEAQERWEKGVDREIPMTAMGVDVGAGGLDRVVLAPRHGEWFAPLISVMGRDAKDGAEQMALVAKHRRNGCAVVVDVGGGYGGDLCSRLKDNHVIPVRFNGSAGSAARAKDGSGRIFVNKRAESWWRFREALNPDQRGGSIIALPPDPELRAELASVTYEPDILKIQIEDKKEVRKRLGRSPDKADACVMAFSPGDVGARRQRSTGGGSYDRPDRANVGFSDIKRSFS